MVLRALHLCSGYGGFELGLRLAGVPARTVCHVERDSYAAATLVARMEEKVLDLAPVWSDLVTFDGSAWRGSVDIVTAGFPCQPFSVAGERRGTDDDRWLWPDIARIVADVGPRYVFLENVPGLVRAGLPHVLSDLACLGFDAEWGMLSAASVGAPHKRERVWILGYATGGEPAESVEQGDSGADVERDGVRSRWANPVHGTGSGVADADGARRQGDGGVGSELGGSRDRGDLGDAVADACGEGRSEVACGVPADARGDVGSVGGGGGDGVIVDGRGEVVGDANGDGLEGVGEWGGGAGGRLAGNVDGSDGAGGVGDAERSGFQGSAVGEVGLLQSPEASCWPPARDDIDGWRQYIASGGPQPSLCRGVDGRPAGLADALHLGGNGLVPAVAASALIALAERAGIDLRQGV